MTGGQGLDAQRPTCFLCGQLLICAREARSPCRSPFLLPCPYPRDLSANHFAGEAFPPCLPGAGLSGAASSAFACALAHHVFIVAAWCKSPSPAGSQTLWGRKPHMPHALITRTCASRSLRTSCVTSSSATRPFEIPSRPNQIPPPSGSLP